MANSGSQEMKRFPSGSAWRKWDLHVHLPRTKLNNGYKEIKGSVDWRKFCQILHASDVSAFGITDYFSLEGFFEFKSKYEKLYGKSSDKVFFPNLELRLPESVNKDGQCVNIHLIFRPDLTEATAQKFMANLVTEIHAKNQNALTCAELRPTDYASATVTRDHIEAAIKATFGKKCTFTDHVIIVTSANGDGIRPGGTSSKKRKNNLVDEIDKLSNGFFGNPGNREHFLRTDRLENKEESIPPKPVFAGCDAHSFSELEAWLGRNITTEGQQKNITWVKADLTFEGLQQTLIEPKDRVGIDPFQPDMKDGYKYISKVNFTGSSDFPAEIPLNPNLNSIIGSRSSGKSALLAFIAHAVDPVETLRVQKKYSGTSEPEIGPAAGRSWSSVDHIQCSVEWGQDGPVKGKVIYIPQNTLYKISEQPSDVTSKIEPVLFRNYPHFHSKHERLFQDIKTENERIKRAVEEWFALEKKIEAIDSALAEIGDKKAISRARLTFKKKVDALRIASKLTKTETNQYQKLVDAIDDKENRLAEIAQEIRLLDSYVECEKGKLDKFRAVNARISVTIAVKPSMDQIPDPLKGIFEKEINNSRSLLIQVVTAELVKYRGGIHREETKLRRDLVQLKESNGELISKNKANIELDKLLGDFKAKDLDLNKIAQKERSRLKHTASQKKNIREIIQAIQGRRKLVTELKTNFSTEERVLEQLQFGIEIGFDLSTLEELSREFKKNEKGDYITKESLVDLEAAQSKPEDFLTQISRGTQRLNLRVNRVSVASNVLMATPEVRYTAVLDSDKIGGFELSSMTPGKQALFALMLILNESKESWPLLIDQPEDDLDSRSIYETIVPYIVKRKSERQIIMVSHDANLVIGADSEEIIVANRHGVDRKNEADQTFDYLTGSLEHSASNPRSVSVLGRHGIREHACEILDGGEVAFQKRKEKYKI